MASFQFNQDRINFYLARLQEAKRTRPALIKELCAQIVDLLDCLEHAEEKIASSILFFNDEKRKRARALRDLKLYWRGLRRERDIFLEGLRNPEWVLIDRRKAGAKTKLKWPTKRHIERIFADEYFEMASRCLGDLKIQVREFEKVATCFKKLKKCIDNLPQAKSKNTRDKSLKPHLVRVPNWVSVNRWHMFMFRRDMVNDFIAVIHNAFERAVFIEDELEDLMLDFNCIDKRRHLSLCVNWDFRPNRVITIGCLGGPYWGQLLINMNREQRNIKRLKLISRNLIRESGYGRHEKKVLDLYKKINRLKKERLQLFGPIFQINKIIQNNLKRKRIKNE